MMKYYSEMMTNCLLDKTVMELITDNSYESNERDDDVFLLVNFYKH